MDEGLLRIGCALIFIASGFVLLNLIGSHLLGGGQGFLWAGLASGVLGVVLLIVGSFKKP